MNTPTIILIAIASIIVIGVAVYFIHEIIESKNREKTDTEKLTTQCASTHNPIERESMTDEEIRQQFPQLFGN